MDFDGALRAAARWAALLSALALGCEGAGTGNDAGPLLAVGIVDQVYPPEARIVRSDDGGDSWTTVGEQRFATPFTLRFFDGGEGIALSRTSLFRSADGAETWQRVSGPAEVLSIDELGGGLVFTPGDAVIYGDRVSSGGPYCSGIPSPAVVSTADGGENWSESAVDGRATTSLGNGCVAGDANALLLGLDRLSPPCVLGTGLYTTRTRGRTWEPAFARGYGGSRPRGIGCTGDGGFWVVGNRSLWHSADGGSTWVDDSSSLPEGVYLDNGSVSFLDQRTGWLAGSTEDAAVLLSTRDGAATWRILPLPPDVRQVAFLDERSGFGVGYSGGPPLHVTHDGGVNWQPVNLPAGIAGISQVQRGGRARRP